MSDSKGENNGRDSVFFIHVVDWGGNRLGCNGIDVTEGESKKTVSTACAEAGGHFLCAFDGLVRDGDPPDGDVVLWSETP
jgi:hypothetical protein